MRCIGLRVFVACSLALILYTSVQYQIRNYKRMIRTSFVYQNPSSDISPSNIERGILSALNSDNANKSEDLKDTQTKNNFNAPDFESNLNGGAEATSLHEDRSQNEDLWPERGLHQADTTNTSDNKVAQFYGKSTINRLDDADISEFLVAIGEDSNNSTIHQDNNGRAEAEDGHTAEPSSSDNSYIPHILDHQVVNSNSMQENNEKNNDKADNFGTWLPSLFKRKKGKTFKDIGQHSETPLSPTVIIETQDTPENDTQSHIDNSRGNYSQISSVTANEDNRPSFEFNGINSPNYKEESDYNSEDENVDDQERSIDPHNITIASTDLQYSINETNFKDSDHNESIYYYDGDNDIEESHSGKLDSAVDTERDKSYSEEVKRIVHDTDSSTLTDISSQYSIIWPLQDNLTSKVQNYRFSEQNQSDVDTFPSDTNGGTQQIQPIKTSDWSTPQQIQEPPQEQRLVQEQPMQNGLKTFPTLAYLLTQQVNSSDLKHFPLRLQYFIHKSMHRSKSGFQPVTGKPVHDLYEYKNIHLPKSSTPGDVLPSRLTAEILTGNANINTQVKLMHALRISPINTTINHLNHISSFTENIGNANTRTDPEVASGRTEEFAWRPTTTFKAAFYDNPRPLSQEDWALYRTKPVNPHMISERVDAKGFEPTPPTNVGLNVIPMSILSSRDRVEIDDQVDHKAISDEAKTKNNSSYSLPVQQNITGQLNETLCPREVKLAKTYHPVTALVAFPEATTQWVINVLEQLTGIQTDSIYDIMADLMLGNAARIYQMGKKIAILTHSSSVRNFDRAIVLISNPFSVESRHQFYRPRSLDWQKSFLWNMTYSSWLSSDLPLFVLLYEDLVENPMSELIQLSAFLSSPEMKTDYNCAMEIARSPPRVIDDVRQIAGIYYQERRRINQNIDSVMAVARQKYPEILARLDSYKVYTGL